MRGLTLHQPWASLVGLGVKTIETRSWSTAYRGPLAIHAGARPIGTGGLSLGPWTNVTGEPIADGKQALLAHYPTARGQLLPTVMFCPLGVIVASCRLVDVVPIVEPWKVNPDRRPPLDKHKGCVATTQPHASTPPSLMLWREGEEYGERIEDQRPYGDFTPGRWAWLLEDVKATTERCPACWGEGDDLNCNEHRYPSDDVCCVCEAKGTCDPIPAKGKQGLWNWEPA